MYDPEGTNEVSFLDIKRLFTEPPKLLQYSNIQMTNESVKMITPYKIADLITFQLNKLFVKRYKRNISKLVDATASVGGNTISFARHFNQVIAIEIKEKTFQMLNDNLQIYALSNVITKNIDFIDYIDHIPIDTDVVFIDPPWFTESLVGSWYNKKINNNLSLSGISIETIKNKLLDRYNVFVVIKAPKYFKPESEPTYKFLYKKMDILVYTA